MKIIATLAAAQLFLLVSGGVTPREYKNVGCYYIGDKAETGRNSTLYPEDVDVSICSRLVFGKGSINNVTAEIQIEFKAGTEKIDGEAFVPRIAKLKAVNPDLKLVLLLPTESLEPFIEPSSRANVIQSGIRWLNESKFDGLAFAFLETNSVVREHMGDLLCEMKSEFDKHGYTLGTVVSDRLFWEATVGNEEPISKLDRCSDYITLFIQKVRTNLNRLAPIKDIKSNVDWYIERGLTAEKLNILIPAIGLLVKPRFPNETGPEVTDPEHPDISHAYVVANNKLQRQLHDTSLEWTVRRDEITKEPYAYSKTGLWMSYEDTDSVKYKARYVMEKGLMGADLVGMDAEDDEGFAGEGRFPLTRAIYNTFRGEDRSEENTT